MTLAGAVVLPLNVTHYGDNMKVFNTKIMEDFAADFKTYNAQNEQSMSYSFHYVYIFISFYP